MFIVAFDGASAMRRHLLGTVGTTTFYSRLWGQWLASERQGERTIPPTFWYLSSIDTPTLLPYAIVIRSPLGALSQCFSILVYTRNLMLLDRTNSKESAPT